MAGFVLADPIVNEIGLAVSTVSVSPVWVNTDLAYEFALDGNPFLAAPSPQTPMQFALSQQRKQQYDASADPGEQTLEAWWLRSQSKWTGGAGIRFMEPTSDERVIRSFRDSAGLDVWTIGQLSLLPQCPLAQATTTTARTVSVRDTSSVDLTAYVYATGVKFLGTGGTVVTTAATGNLPSWLASDGSIVYACHSGGVYKVTTAGVVTSFWTGTSIDRAWWTKQRLFAANGAALYNLAGAGGAVPAAYWTHPSPDWHWTSATEGPSAIYLAGYAGSKSAIYRVLLDNAGDVPTTTIPVATGDLPYGEQILGIQSYLGAIMGVATSKGVRIATIENSGAVTIGPLTWKGTTTGFMVGKDRFLYVGVADAGDGKSGLIRIDLSDPDDTGRYPYANDLQTHSTSAVDGVSTLGTDNRIVIGLASTGVYLESSTLVETSGFLRTGSIRYNTLEPKSFKALRIRGNLTNGSVTAASIDKLDNEVNLATITSADADTEIQISPTTPQESMGLRITLTSNVAATAGPLLRGWQLKALPAVPRSKMLRLPLLCYDREQDRFGVMRTTTGFAWSRYISLRASCLAGETVLLQDLLTNESFDVIIEDLQLNSDKSAPKVGEWQGILTIVARSIA